MCGLRRVCHCLDRAGSEVRHAVIMGTIQTALTLMAMIEFHDKAPLWFWIAGIAVTVPAAWCGGIVRAKVIDKTMNRRKIEATI